VIEVATAGRGLKPGEQALGMREAACARTPLAFVTSHPAPNGIARADLPGVYADPAVKWADGSPLKIIMRAQSGSEMPYLASRVPGLREAFDSAAQRQGMAIGATDQQNAQLATRIDGSFAMMTVLQLRSEGLPLRTVRLDGVEPSAETLADGSYPFSLRICLILPAEPTPGALEVVRQVRSEEGQALFRSLGAEPSD
jgi:phosphate transport system substrate-binding protein